MQNRCDIIKLRDVLWLKGFILGTYRGTMADKVAIIKLGKHHARQG